MVWLNEQDKTETEITNIRANNKGSGYIISGLDFDCFAWKKDVLIDQLFIAISKWVEDGSGFKLKVVADKQEKRGFTITFVQEKGKRVSIPWYVVDNGFTTKKSEDVLSNPFL